MNVQLITRVGSAEISHLENQGFKIFRELQIYYNLRERCGRGGRCEQRIEGIVQLNKK